MGKLEQSGSISDRENQMTSLPAVQTGFSFVEMERLAKSVAASRLFGIQTIDQALVLMAISQAEGRHPALAARDYDIIQNRPSKKAEAMQRDFLAAGGTVKWSELSDTRASAVFSHPQGGTVTIEWDMKRAALAGLAGKDMWKKFPRQMLRSRCISEGVRTVFPAATSGMYVPEEVRDFSHETIDVTPPKEEPEKPTVADQMDQWRAEREGAPALADLMGKMETAACQGMERLKFVWLNELTAKERGALGAHGRSSGPNMDRWKTIASHFDASKQVPSPALPGETERPAVEPPTGDALPPTESTTDVFGLGEHPDDAFFREVLNAVKATTVPAGLDEVKARWAPGGVWHKRMEEIPQALWAELMVRVGDHEKAMES